MRSWPDPDQRPGPWRSLLLLALLSVLAPAAAPQEATQTPAQGSETAGIEAETPPETVGPDLSVATAKIREGAYAEAEELLATLETEYPDDPALLLMRGEVLLAMGRADEALVVLERGVSIDPQRPRLHFQLATALASTGDSERALEQFAREIESNPDPAVQTLAHLNRSMLLQQARRWGDAAAELEAVLKTQPDRVEAFGDLASLYIQAGDTAAAIDALERGKAAGFDSAPHFYSLGARLYNSKRYEDAVAVFSEALRVDPGLAEAERSLAAALERLGRDDEARAHLRKYLELRPDAPDAAAVADRLEAEGKAGE
jgi:tetratricopeptide (TPR) repeat protein